MTDFESVINEERAEKSKKAGRYADIFPTNQLMQ